MPQTNENPAADRAFAMISEVGLDTSKHSEFNPSTQIKSAPPTNSQKGKFHPGYFPEFISTPAAIELRDSYFIARKTHPIRKRKRRYSGAAETQPELQEVIE